MLPGATALSKERLTQLLRRWPLWLALAFTLYSTVLLTYAVGTWQRMREDATAYLVADNQRRATTLGDLAEQLTDTASAHAEFSEIRSYLLNRDLGMSPRYGLGISLAAIEQRFAQTTEQFARRWSIPPPRIVFYSESNHPLADSHPGSPDLPLPLHAGLQAHLRIDIWRGVIEIVVPVMHKDKREGMVATTLPIEILYRNMLPPDSAVGYRELLLSQDGKRPPRRDFGVPLQDAQLRQLTTLRDNHPYPADTLGDLVADSPLRNSLLVKTPVPGTALVLVTFLPEKLVYGHLVSRHLLIGAGALLVLMLFGAFKLDRMRRRAGQLEASVATAEQQRALTEFRNVELSAEIQRRQKLEQALAENQERWELAISGTNDGIWDWNIKTGEAFYSSRWKAMLGYNDTELERHVEVWSDLVHPDDGVRVQAQLERHLRGETPHYQCEYRLRCKDGHYKWILDRGRALLDANGHPVRMAGSHTDITEQRLAEERIADRNAQLDAIFSLSPDAFVSFDASRRVKYANPAFLHMTRFLEHEIVGLEEADFSALLARRCALGTPFEGVTAMRASEEALGAAHPYAAQPEGLPRLLIELSGPGKPVLELKLRLSDAPTVSQILYLRDVTHEAEVDRMKSEFLSHAAHELRTPMASIFGFTELLTSQEFDAETRTDLLQTIHKQTAWLIEIINELLDIARIESRRGKDLKIEAVPLAPVVIDVLTSLQIDAGRWPVTVDVPVVLPPVRADAAKLRQLLTNILGNAVKYSPNGGGIVIKGFVQQIDGRPRVRLAVTDHGMGVSEEQVAHACDRFYRADTSGNIPGTGLGLSIVKEVVELLGGAIDIASAPGLGTTVALCLPVPSAATKPDLPHA